MTDLATVVPIRAPYIARAKASNWRTPPGILVQLAQLWGAHPDLDPCASPDPAHAIAKRNLAGPAGSPADGLTHPWRGRVFVNPPFSDLALWTEKASREAKDAWEIVMLLPARTDTRYWHQHVSTADAIAFLRGRLRFVGAPGPCPFPTAIAYWGPRPWAFYRVFQETAMVVAP